MSKNVPFWSVLAHIFETSGWNNITFGSQGDIGIIHSLFSDFDLGMPPCDLELFLVGGWASAGRPFTFELTTLGEKVGYCESLPSYVVSLGASYILFIDECNASKIFKMALNSFNCCNRGYIVLRLSNSSYICTMTNVCDHRIRGPRG